MNMYRENVCVRWYRLRREYVTFLAMSVSEMGERRVIQSYGNVWEYLDDLILNERYDTLIFIMT